MINLNKPLCIVPRGSDNLCFSALFGVRSWLTHLPNAPRPVFTHDLNQCENPPIIFYENPTLDSAGVCKKHEWGYEITIREPSGANSQVPAHEIGHALGIWWHRGIADASLMSADASFMLTPEDMADLCQVHPEIKCPQYKWCEGTFKYPHPICPAATPIDSVIQWRKQQERK
jgi:hypothetical protein